MNINTPAPGVGHPAGEERENTVAAPVGERAALPFCPQPKPEKRSTTNGRKHRAEDVVKQLVRAACVRRDGDCRLKERGFGVCGGESEWCHLEEKKRARTRGMPPEIRHTTQDSAQMCSVHHRRYDAGEIALEYLTPARADGRMAWWDGLHEYQEAA